MKLPAGHDGGPHVGQVVASHVAYVGLLAAHLVSVPQPRDAMLAVVHPDAMTDEQVRELSAALITDALATGRGLDGPREALGMLREIASARADGLPAAAVSYPASYRPLERVRAAALVLDAWMTAEARQRVRENPSDR